MSRSYTSRPLRPGEREGVDYHFISRAEFDAMIADNAFLEWADVFGNLYGTAAADVEQMLDERPGRGAGDRRAGRAAGAAARSPITPRVFVMPPSFQVLERRLRGRSTDPEAALQRRLETARAEVSSYREYDYVVVNDDLESTVVRLQEIIAAERSRVHRMDRVADAIVRTFFVGWSRPGRRNHGTHHRRRRAEASAPTRRWRSCAACRSAGHDVTVVMTRSARRFVGELTFEAITRQRVVTSQWAPGAERRHRAHRAGRPRRICCSWCRPPPTSSASSRTASPTTS